VSARSPWHRNVTLLRENLVTLRGVSWRMKKRHSKVTKVSRKSRIAAAQ
jgi:hypothetical protein